MARRTALKPDLSLIGRGTDGGLGSLGLARIEVVELFVSESARVDDLIVGLLKGEEELVQLDLE